MSNRQEYHERDIFGGSDSELSSSSDDDDTPRQQQKPRRRASPSAARRDDADTSGDSGDEYVQEKRAGGRPVADGAKPKRRSKPRADDGGERVQKKRKRKVVVEEDLADLPPDVAAKRRLDMEIDRILKPKKGVRKPKKKKGDEDVVLDRFADEEVSRLREAMLQAADDDEQANRDKLPAMAKLRLLPQVTDVLRKSSLEQSIIDNNLLEGVRRWLEPLPDRSLPALNIQNDFFRELRTMKFVDAPVLKESGLGRVVLFYAKCPRATPEITRIASDLVAKWSRPIIKRSASYRDRLIPTAPDAYDGDGPAAGGGAGSGASQGQGGSQGAAYPRAEGLNAVLARARAADKNRVRKNAVAIPQRELGTYTVAPRAGAGFARGSSSVDEDVQRRKQNAERLRSLTRKVALK